MVNGCPRPSSIKVSYVCSLASQRRKGARQNETNTPKKIVGKVLRVEKDSVLGGREVASTPTQTSRYKNFVPRSSKNSDCPIDVCSVAFLSSRSPEKRENRTALIHS